MLWTLKPLALLSTVVMAGAQPDVEASLIDEGPLQSAGLTRSWQARLPVGAGDSIQKVHLVDEALYVLTNGGVLFALKADVGLLRWGAKLTERDYKVYKPTHLRNAEGTGPVIVSTTTETFIYDRFSGNLLTSFVPEFPPGSAAVGYDNTVFLGSSNGRFYSLALSHPRTNRLTKRWEVVVGGPITATPVLYGGNKLLFASQDGVVYSCFAVGKGFDWAFRTEGPIFGDPVVDEGGVYVASSDRSLYKIHSGVGEVLWRARFPNALTQEPVVSGHTVYQYCPDFGLAAIDADTGEEKWHNAHAVTFVAHSRGRDVLFTRDQCLEVVEHETGKLLHSIDAYPAALAVSNPRDDAVYLLGRTGRVLCARMENVPYLRLQQILASRGRLNLPPLEKTVGSRQDSGRSKDEAARRRNDPLRSRRDVGP